MGKLLETKLPISIGEVSYETFNRLVRVLELSLNKVYVNSTLAVNETQLNENKFNKGDIICNLTSNQLQVWTGEKWVNLYSENETNFQASAELGNVTVTLGGVVTIQLGVN